MIRPTILLLALAACGIDNTVSGKEEGEDVIDTGDPFTLTLDTQEETDTEDSGTTTIPVDMCPDQFFAGGFVEQDDECYQDAPTPGTFTPIVEWDKETFSIDGGSVSCMMQPIVCSLTDDNGDGVGDDDDMPDVVIITYSPGVLRALNGDDGSEIWGSSGSGNIQITGGAACGDVDNDGWQDVVAATSSGVDVFDHEGNLQWSTSGCGGHMDGTSDAPGIADMDGDGNPEIIIGNCIIDNSGNVVGQGAYGYGTSSNVGSAGNAVDIDQDGELEVVAGNALYNIDGDALWYNGESDGYIAVGNFDSDDNGEIVVTGDAQMRIQDDDGTVLCRNSIPAASGSYGGPPTVADFDGDGEAEVGVAANSTYTVFEGDCDVLWQYTGTTDPSSGNTGSSVFDFEGDGVADVVYADEHWVWVFDGVDGEVKMQDATHTNNTWLEYPTIADINDDGSADIAVCNTPGSWGSMNGVTVFGDADQSWRPGRKIWNQHAYDITNVNDDGSIPDNPDTNWLSYNNFRSGDLTPGEGYSGPDLFAEIHDVCAGNCSQGSVTVWFSVGNRGFNDVDDDFLVEIWAETDAGLYLAWSTLWTATAYAAAQSDAEQVELTGLPETIYDIGVFVDYGNNSSASEVDECHEDNNEEWWGAYVCL